MATPFTATHIFVEGRQDLTVKPSAVLVVPLLFLLGCGGNAAPRGGSVSTPTPTPTGGSTNGPSAPPSTANLVTVAAGQTAGSIDVVVSAPAASPAPNAQDLGVAALTGSGTAMNTGDIIHRGKTARILLFGPGLAGDMQISIRGPADITISNIQSITATDGTPGVQFTAVAAPDAALGARTVVLQSSKGDITTFTGGLEVAP